MEPQRPFTETMHGLSRWAWIRGICITLGLAICFVAASPSPGKVSGAALKDPIAREELNRWVQIFSWAGVEMTPEDVAALTVDLADTWKTGKNYLLTPFRPIWKITATQQGWGLFTYPDTHPYRLEVSWREKNGPYTVIYRSLDREYDFLEGPITFRRVRGMYNPGRKVPKTYKGVTEWYSAMVFERIPEAQRVRFRFHRAHTPTPGQVSDGEHSTRFSRVVRRENLP